MRMDSLILFHVHTYRFKLKLKRTLTRLHTQKKIALTRLRIHKNAHIFKQTEMHSKNVYVKTHFRAFTQKTNETCIISHKQAKIRARAIGDIFAYICKQKKKKKNVSKKTDLLIISVIINSSVQHDLRAYVHTSSLL